METSRKINIGVITIGSALIATKLLFNGASSYTDLSDDTYLQTPSEFVIPLENVTIGDAYNVYPSSISPIQACFNYEAGHAIRHQASKDAFYAIYNNTYNDNQASIGELPVELKDDFLRLLMPFEMDKNKADVLYDTYAGESLNNFMSVETLTFYKERYENFANAIATDPVLQSIKNAGEMKLKATQQVSDRIATHLYNAIYGDLYDQLTDAQKAKIDGTPKISFYRDEDSSTVAGYAFDRIRINLAMTDDMGGLFGTLGHELSHSLEERLLMLRMFGVLDHTHPLYNVIAYVESASDDNYTTAFEQTYIRNPAEIMARVSGEVTVQYYGNLAAVTSPNTINIWTIEHNLQIAQLREDIATLKRVPEAIARTTKCSSFKP